MMMTKSAVVAGGITAMATGMAMGTIIMAMATAMVMMGMERLARHNG
jgi:hypothetical protein